VNGQFEGLEKSLFKDFIGVLGMRKEDSTFEDCVS
jgi:hypothetical protein